jgi:hypothetical protein
MTFERLDGCSRVMGKKGLKYLVFPGYDSIPFCDRDPLIQLLTVTYMIAEAGLRPRLI